MEEIHMAPDIFITRQDLQQVLFKTKILCQKLEWPGSWLTGCYPHLLTHVFVQNFELFFFGVLGPGSTNINVMKVIA